MLYINRNSYKLDYALHNTNSYKLDYALFHPASSQLNRSGNEKNPTYCVA